MIGILIILGKKAPHPNPLPARGRAVRRIRDGFKDATLCNQRGSPWPDLVRPSMSSVWKSPLPQNVDARDEPGQGAFGRQIGRKTPSRTGLKFSGGQHRARGGGGGTREAGEPAPDV